MDKKLQNKLVSTLKNHKLTLDELCDVFKNDPDEMKSLLGELQEAYIPVDISTGHTRKGLLYHINMLPESTNIFKISDKDNKERTMNFVATSDFHFASIFHLPKTFHEAMQKTIDSGITRVYVAGDVVDGRSIYRGHLENLVTASLEGQTDIVAEALSKYPELEFWAIAGNHDYSHTKLNGSKPLAILESKLDNFKNLGDFRADIIYHGIRIRLLHGGTGRAYATSYPSQTYLRDYFKGLEREDMKNIPHIILLGHFHTLYQGKDHGIHIIQSGSFQDSDNEYCVRRGLTGPNGLFHVEMDYKNAIIDRFATEYIQPKILSKEKGEAFARTTVNYNARKRHK